MCNDLLAFVTWKHGNFKPGITRGEMFVSSVPWNAE